MSEKKRQLKKSLLVTEQGKKYELPKKGERIDYSTFEADNWILQGSDNKLLAAIKKHGGGLWVGHDWRFHWRQRPETKVYETDGERFVARVLTQFLKRKESVRFISGKQIGKDWYPPEVELRELMSAEDEFTPFSNSEFYIKDGLWYRTSFKPSKYLAGKYGISGARRPEIIMKLIRNLCNHNDMYFTWVINWLAGFFQTLKKSQVALLLRGDQGSGKGLFFNHVITPLFGDDFCVTVDSSNLESDFKNWIEGRLFLNLNEVAVDMKGRRNVKNFLKQLVSDPFVNIQTKFKDFKVTEVFANILITSNEVLPIEVEVRDRRFTVLNTGRGLIKQGWDTQKAVADIKEELPAFAEFLKNYAVDWAMYHKALDTPEKAAIVTGTTSQVRLFSEAVSEKDLVFFAELEDDVEGKVVYNRLRESFTKGQITADLLFRAFSLVFETRKSAKKLMGELRTLMPDVFGMHKLKKSNGTRYYEI